MSLELKMPYAAMDAKAVDEIPIGDEWQYEPKWDGFRAIVFRDGDVAWVKRKNAARLERMLLAITRVPRAQRVARMQNVLPRMQHTIAEDWVEHLRERLFPQRRGEPSEGATSAAGVPAVSGAARVGGASGS